MEREYFVYVLYSAKSGKTYTGHTNILEKRLFQHNSGFEISTKYGAPWLLFYKQKYSSRSEAMKREKELKSGKGREEIQKYIPGSPPRRTKD